MGIKERLFKRTPPFFRKLRTAGIVLIAAGSTIGTVNVSLPGIVKEISGYLIVAGSVMVAVSQAVVKDEE
ncbi:hypothetical protein GFS24_09450 [Chitinophaga sp. SYP-B3965]|uniref:hypothetical protein n=1 Tax=Chitinophaga sp. SYP-B3965 TaxID=2663120 RepID=UPI001299B0DB|nr:hypothetical protein [Chitinophaga sp. SYP-B3965]MRG45341.1 hypothetical protein [Chitinophaga sp. SYP-B3965]